MIISKQLSQAKKQVSSFNMSKDMSQSENRLFASLIGCLQYNHFSSGVVSYV